MKIIQFMTAMIAVVTLASTVVAADALFNGKTEKELLAAKGTPKTKAALGLKIIYTWDNARATVIDGKVIEYRENTVVVESQKPKAAPPAKQPPQTPKPATPTQDPRVSAAQQRLSDALKQMNKTSGIKAQKMVIAQIQQSLDMYDRQSVFNHSGYTISTEQHEVDKARLEVETARLQVMESEAGN